MSTTLKAVGGGSSNIANRWLEEAGSSYPNANATISATANTKTILLTGDRHLEFTEDVSFWLLDDVNTPRIALTVAADATFVSPNTVIVVNETIQDGTVGNAMKYRAPVAADDVDIAGFAIVQAGGPLSFVSLIDTGETKGTFEITNNFTCLAVSCPIFCNTGIIAGVPIQLDVYVSVESSSPAFENQAGGLVDVGDSTFVNTTGKGVSNFGTIVGTVLDGTSEDAAGISNEGDIQCDEVNGTGSYYEGIYNTGTITGDCDGTSDYGEGITNIPGATITGAIIGASIGGMGVYNTGTLTGTTVSGTSEDNDGIYNTGEIDCDTLTGIAETETVDSTGSGVHNATGGVIVCRAITGEGDMCGVINAGTITGAITAFTNAQQCTTGLINSGTINMIGELNATTVANSGYIQSAYTKPPTDIIGAGMF